MEELIKYWNEYTLYLLEREQVDKINYDDNDFSFKKFMHWVSYIKDNE